MKVEIVRDKFLRAITQAERVSGKHISLPVLSCIICEAKGSTMTVKATNLDVGIEITVPAKVEEEGIVAVSGAILKAFLSNSNSDKNVILSKSEETLMVSSGGNKAMMKTQASEDFPLIPQVQDGNMFSIRSRDLVEGIKSVWWAASLSNIKPELSSVYIYEANSDLIFVATDSFRLAEKKIHLKKEKGIKDMLVPFKNISEIARMLEEIDEEVTVRSNANQISIEAEGIYMTSRLIEGNFPNYKEIIPKEFNTKVIVLKSDLGEVLKLIGNFSDKFNQAIFHFLVSKKTLLIESKDSEVGKGETELKGNFEGQDLDITFNHKYISDSLSSLGDESVEFRLVGPQKPMIIKPSRSEGFTYLVMPMNK